jgi:hypothetical protein
VKATSGCPGVRISAEKLEAFVLDSVYSKLLSDERIETLFREAVKPRLDKVSQQKAEVKGRIDGLANIGDVRQLPVTKDAIVGLRATVQAMTRTKDNPQIRSTVPWYAKGYCRSHYLMMARGTLEYGKEPVRGSDGRFATKR